MYLTRSESNRKLPIPRKGTKYLARASNHWKNGVSVVIAIRDILKLAKTSKEVKEMIKQKMIKINGKEVKDIKEGIRLLNILEADKKYKLTILQTGRFSFEETKEENRICKVVNKIILRDKKTQINLHDGTNILSDEKISNGDSLELDFSGKVKKVINFEKGKKGFVISGRSVGKYGKIEKVSSGKTMFIMEDKTVELDKDHVIVI